MPTLTSLTVNLRGDSSSLVRATRSSLRAVGSLTAGIGRSVLKVGGLAAAIGGLAGGAGLLKLASASRESVDNIGKLSTQLGVSGTEVQKIGLVAELSGMKSEGLIKAMQRVTRIVGDAGAGSKEAGKLIERLGLSYDELNEATSLDRFAMVVAALNKTKDATEKASIGNKLFEEQWQRMNPLLTGFAGNMSRAGAVFDDMGFGIGDLSKGVEGLNDDMSVFSAMLVQFRNLVFAKVAPILGSLTTSFGMIAQAQIEAAGGAGKLADALINKVLSAGDKVSDMFAGMKDAITGIVATFGFLIDVVQAIAQISTGLGAAAVTLGGGNVVGAGRILADIPGAALGEFGSEDDPATRELEEQTSLLRDIARLLPYGRLVF